MTALRIRTRVKICGLSTKESALHAAACGADLVGFVFVEGSPRFIDPGAAAEIMATLPPGVTSAAVIRDFDEETFYEAVQACPCEIWQPHGNETDALLAEYGGGLVKGFKFDPKTIDVKLERFAGLDAVSAILVDGSDGGTGTTFDWSQLAQALERAAFAKPVFLAGGLVPANVADAIAAVKPWAVDVSSGVESEPGVKDLAKIEAFCRAVKEADAG
ncbi:MAG: phosphoribosylanthranilate isomerase [Planctomycetota bacterium]